MQANSKAPGNVDEYIERFPAHVQTILQKLRATIKNSAPAAEETISYQMPAFKYHGMLVYFAGYQNHIGFYPTSSPMKVFKDRLTNYKTSKGAIQFPIDKAIPLTLVKDIVKFRIKENLEKENSKLKKKR
ncbi:MAG TPA: DUF1801 domain-containing protein [Chitinophagaceae bacterium]|jgi:uncharacterized protein YdhG (YjbR/CyaY superfamily)|nr:DUF1801 domain-containing protein [Chitinophagaceae bacterium]